MRPSGVRYCDNGSRDVAARAGIAGFHPHRLRDMFAVGLVTAGLSIEDVNSLLGHSSLQTTERHYAPWDRRRRDRLAQVIRAASRKNELPGTTSFWPSQFG